MITYEYELDVTPGGAPVCVNLNQYDQDYLLKFYLYSRQGVLDIKQGTTAEICGTKKDGKGYSVAVSIDENVVTVSGDNQMTAMAGRQFFELKLKLNGKELNTANFVICVERAALDKDTVKSESVIKELDNAAELADKIIKNAKETEDNIKKVAENVSKDAAAAALKAENAAASASQAEQSAEVANDYSKESESHSHGGTGTRPGEDTDNSLYYSQQSKLEYERAKKEADRAEAFSNFVTPDFLILNNQVYIKIGGTVDFILLNNQIYYKMPD